MTKPVLCWQVYNLASHHVEAWIDCQLASLDIIFLMNNQSGIYERLATSRSLPQGMIESIIPLSPDTFLDLGLPLIPFHKQELKHVIYYCSDYGFYVAAKLYKNCANCLLFKIDHDVFLYGMTWPDLVKHLVSLMGSALTLQVNSCVNNDWYWHRGSVSAYGQNYKFGLFGFQAVKIDLALRMHAARIEMWKLSAYPSLTADVLMTGDLSYPICETFFHTELYRYGVTPLQLFKSYPHLSRCYKLEANGGLASIDIPHILSTYENRFWIFHPWKPLI